jgi:putative heme-binding domain-containing protein
LERFFTTAVLLVANDSADGLDRAVAARLLAARPVSYTDPSHWVRTILGTSEPPLLQAATLAAMGRFGHPRVADDLLQSWRALPPPLRLQAGGALLAREERAGVVLDALAAGRIGPGELAPAQADFLRTHRDPAISARAVQLLGPLTVERPAVMQEFEPAARMAGDASQGRRLFVERCAACHQFGGEGQRLGPDLTGVRVRGRTRILEAMLEPNLEVSPEYAASVVETREGEVMIGVTDDAGPLTLTVRQPGGIASVWARECVRSMETQVWSLMPEGLERGLATQDMADLLEYLTTAPWPPN